ncbi:hypothetical protein FOH24_15135, partial [Acetobacter tropicalis]
QIAHVSSVKVPVLSPSSIPTIWEEIQDLTGPRIRTDFMKTGSLYATKAAVRTGHDVPRMSMTAASFPRA